MSFINDFINGFKEYMTQTWKNRPSMETPISAERLNHIESGIKSISDAIKNMASAIMKDMADLTIGASDWNAAEGEPGYVKNRTHWMEFVSKEEVILEETRVPFNSNMTSLYGIGSDKVVAGKPYIVYWNEAVYECTAFVADQSVFLGNSSLASTGDDTGEPFCMEMLTATSAFVMKSNSNAEIITIKIETPEVVRYHTIDPEFLPEGIGGGVTSWNDLENKPFGEEVQIVELFPETLLTESIEMRDPTWVVPMDGESLIVGETYVVRWNGVEYECVCQDLSTKGDSISGLGNLIAFEGTSNREPFGVLYRKYRTGTQVLAQALDETTDTPTLSISERKDVLKQLDPKFVEGMYYSEDGGIIEILPETTVSVETDGAFFDPVPPLTGGKTYIVTYNDVPYELEAVEMVSDGLVLTGLGDVDMFTTGTPSGVAPFVIMIFPEEYAVEIGVTGLCMSLDGSESATVSISCENEIVHKLDNKYLGLDWLPVVDTKTGLMFTFDDVCPSQGLISNTGYDHSGFFEVKNGEKYTVTINGDVYECVGEAKFYGNMKMSYLGNKGISNSSELDTGEPFLFAIVSTNGVVQSTSGLKLAEQYYGEHVHMEVTGNVYLPNTMPEEFMPKSVDGIVIRSSTIGSTKKFKLTVNDSGAISATEVIE